MTDDLLRDVSLVEVALCAAVLSFTSRRMVARHIPSFGRLCVDIGHRARDQRQQFYFFVNHWTFRLVISYQTLFFCGWATQMAGVMFASSDYLRPLLGSYATIPGAEAYWQSGFSVGRNRFRCLWRLRYLWDLICFRGTQRCYLSTRRWPPGSSRESTFSFFAY